MKKSIRTFLTAFVIGVTITVTSNILTTYVSAAPTEFNTTTKECTLISVVYKDNNLILNLVDDKGNLWQWAEESNFYYDKPVTCQVTFDENKITKVDFD
jgi:hypothetical protein